MVAQFSFSQNQPRATSDSAVTLVGKSYADERGQQTFQIMRELSRTLAQQPEPNVLGVPQALFYDPGLRLLAQQRIAGVPYRDLLDRPDLAGYLRLAGKALSTLHSQNMAVGREVGLSDHLADLVAPHPRALCEHLPEYRARVEALIGAMEDQERAWRPKTIVGPIHRDFHLRKLLYAQGRAWLVDWDLFARGDTALDIGSFIAHLQLQLATQHKRAIGAFIDGYFEERPLVLLERVPLYAAFTYLKLACRRFALREPRWDEQVRDLLRRAETCLATNTIV
jgi:aminoglycoside phosphotransferase (APT) family kinase protein